MDRTLDSLHRYEPDYQWDPKRKGYYPVTEKRSLLKKRKRDPRWVMSPEGKYIYIP